MFKSADAYRPLQQEVQQPVGSHGQGRRAGRARILLRGKALWAYVNVPFSSFCVSSDSEVYGL